MTCEGAIVADHSRVWAQHHTISDFKHTVGVKLLRQGHGDRLRPTVDAVTGDEVEIRALGVYD